MGSELRRLPSVDKVISDERIKRLRELYPHDLIVGIVRQRLEADRLAITSGSTSPSLDEIVDSVCSQVAALEQLSLRPVVNASGVIIHTNLGRAPLSKEAAMAMGLVATGYCNLEFDLDSGARGSRDVHIEQLLCQLTGAEAALVVNNNASAVLLALTVLAKRKEVIVSRSQAVEIGGGFRIPDVMRQSGAKLVEVGTTNCTYIYDYEQAIGPRTAALLRVHSSNFRVEGFTHSVALEEMVVLGDKHGIPVLDDVGSGCLLDTAMFGLAPEPVVQQSISLGVGLACFSGDKLLGGPQSGIIVGKKLLVDKLRRHPLARALRVDKIRLAGLAATSVLYLKGEALEKIPVWRMISMPLDEVEKRARLWAQDLGGLARVIEGETMVGGGSLPGSTLPTRLVAIEGKVGRRNIALSLARKLRHYDPPVIGRISDDVLLFDPRTVLPEEDDTVLLALRSAVASLK
ncbi:MAG: L-seryl-tRNA(Sec) selenium transferase [Chloroflexi bacterium RBG_19FT_COMBO_48_23]|nr:MAG: L-seryl-tRNA(Sec) selenium transferase [Chloroflexi bacterium RBG_19FT_COMBO_48_23]